MKTRPLPVYVSSHYGAKPYLSVCEGRVSVCEGRVFRNKIFMVENCELETARVRLPAARHYDSLAERSMHDRIASAFDTLAPCCFGSQVRIHFSLKIKS